MSRSLIGVLSRSPAGLWTRAFTGSSTGTCHRFFPACISSTRTTRLISQPQPHFRRFMSTSGDDDGFSSSPTGSMDFSGSKPLYAPYTVFKTRAAMTIRFVPPIIQDRGAFQVLKRPGSIQFEIANASGERVYDWAKKEVFQLNASEIGDILSQQGALAPITSTVEVKYTHDPGLGSSDAGQVRKTLSIRRGSSPNKTAGAPARGVYFVNLSVRSRQGETSQYNMQLSDGEFTIMTGLMQTCIPHLFAWSHVVTPQVIASDSPASSSTDSATRTNTTNNNNTTSSGGWDK